MRFRGKRWSPDKRGLLTAAAGIAGAIAGIPVPLDCVADAVFSLAHLSDADAEAWHDRLISGIGLWVTDHPEVEDMIGGLFDDWPRLLLRELDRIDAPLLLGSEPRTRELLEEALAKTVFLPATGSSDSWAASRLAAHRLAVDMPRLLLEAAETSPGLLALRQILEGDLATILDRLPPDVADRGILQGFLTATAEDLDHDSWTRQAGGTAASVTGMARGVSVIIETDSGDGLGTPPGVTTGVAELLARCDRLILMGDSGAGKSWLAKRIAIETAMTALEKIGAGEDPESVEVPLFALCSEVLAMGAPTWEALVAAAVGRVASRLGPGQAQSALTRRFLERPGRYLVIFDGLDEALSATREAFDQLTAAAGRILRIVLTTRPEAWGRELELDPENPRHSLARIQPLDYPDDVVPIVDAWLSTRPAARDRLIDDLAARAELADASRTPILCAIFCLLADADRPLPVTRHELYTRVVTRLLRGTWRIEELRDDDTLELAVAALRELAWAGAVDDPASGLAAWPESVVHSFSPPVAGPVLGALSNVAPLARYNPDARRRPRHFMHTSIREHLVGEYLTSLPVSDASEKIEPHLWYDGQWRGVLPTAIADHPERDALLRRVILGTEEGLADIASLDRRDGFGELRRLMLRLSAESSPEDWSPDVSALIERILAEAPRAIPSRLVVARNGWRAAGTTEQEFSRLAEGDVPWAPGQIRQWMIHLKATSTDLAPVAASLAARLAAGLREVMESSLVDVAVAFDALEPEPEQRDCAVQGLLAQLRSEAYPIVADALRVLEPALTPPDVLGAVMDQLESACGSQGGGYRADVLVEVIVVLGGDASVLGQAADLLLERLAEGEYELKPLIDALGRCQLDVDRRTRALELVLTIVARAARDPSWTSDEGIRGWDTRRPPASARQLVRWMGRLWPPESQAGEILVRLITKIRPDLTRDLRGSRHRAFLADVFELLASEASEPERRRAASLVLQELPNAPMVETWVRRLERLEATETERHVAVEALLARNPPLEASTLAFLARRLGPTVAQAQIIVSRLTDQFRDTSGETLIELCELVGEFSPDDHARMAAVEPLIDVAASLTNFVLSAFDRAVRSLSLTDLERHRLTKVLIERLNEAQGDELRQLSYAIKQVATPDDRIAAADVLTSRIERTLTSELVGLLLALEQFDPDRPRALLADEGRIAIVTEHPPDNLILPAWVETLLRFGLIDAARRCVLEAAESEATRAEYLVESVKRIDPADQDVGLTDLLIGVLRSADESELSVLAEAIHCRQLSEDRRRSATHLLLTRLRNAPQEARLALLEAIGRFQFDEEQECELVNMLINWLGSQDGDGFRTGRLTATILAAFPRIERRARVVEAIVAGFLADPWATHDEDAVRCAVRLGFDASALRRLAEQAVARHVAYDRLNLAGIARALRQTSDLVTWSSSLDAWAEISGPIFDTLPDG